ncbi:MAG: hypothetical protein JWN16_2542 [Alphaproteobacteria bacterium]|jgi:hypothetical protein|nr:hypothetical protein [Alphaproteobacteria bacterium]
MDRIAIIVASIVIATALVVGASYGALWLQPLLLEIPTNWVLIATGSILPVGYLLTRRRTRA